MIFIAYAFALIFLLILSVIDVKTFHEKDGFIPAYLTTIFMIIMFVLMGPSGIVTGLFGCLIALFYVDLDTFQGIPDVKIFVAMAMTMPSIFMVGVLGLICSCSLLMYKLSVGKGETKIPGIPFLLVSYAVTLGVLLL